MKSLLAAIGLLTSVLACQAGLAEVKPIKAHDDDFRRKGSIANVLLDYMPSPFWKKKSSWNYPGIEVNERPVSIYGASGERRVETNVAISDRNSRILLNRGCEINLKILRLEPPVVSFKDSLPSFPVGTDRRRDYIVGVTPSKEALSKVSGAIVYTQHWHHHVPNSNIVDPGFHFHPSAYAPCLGWDYDVVALCIGEPVVDESDHLTGYRFEADKLSDGYVYLALRRQGSVCRKPAVEKAFRSWKKYRRTSTARNIAKTSAPGSSAFTSSY